MLDLPEYKIVFSRASYCLLVYAPRECYYAAEKAAVQIRKTAGMPGQGLPDRKVFEIPRAASRAQTALAPCVCKQCLQGRRSYVSISPGAGVIRALN